MAWQAVARAGDPKAVVLPVPMKAKKDMNFSYAGLKNAFRMAVQRRREALGLTDDQDLDDASKVHTRGTLMGEILSHGLKPAPVLYDARIDQADLAASFQSTAIQHLEERLERAMAHCEKQGITTLAGMFEILCSEAALVGATP
jgi:N6-L-threonylcarbamoyladenine synthase